VLEYPVMLNQIKKIFGKTYQPLNIIEISKENLLHNYKVLSSLNRGIKIAPVLKSNAYGHGLMEVARVMDQAGAPFFCVDSIYEAYELLKAEIKTPILIMGYVQPENLKVKKLPFKYAVSTLDLAEAINKYQPSSGVHIFVDTGMHREGVLISELPEFLKKLPRNLKIEGLMSHLASGDRPNDLLTKLQVKHFDRALGVLKDHKINPGYRHLASSDGLISSLPKFSTNIARVGISLFGIASHNNLKPVLNFKTQIVQVKKLQKGDRVGYDQTFPAKKEMTIGILPAGYYDGVDRRLSNKGWVIIYGKPCKIIGRVSMNITAIDLSKVTNYPIGQSVTIYSGNPSDPNSIANSAKICQTIPYDLLVKLAPSTKRLII